MNDPKDSTLYYNFNVNYYFVSPPHVCSLIINMYPNILQTAISSNLIFINESTIDQSRMELIFKLLIFIIGCLSSKIGKISIF